MSPPRRRPATRSSSGGGQRTVTVDGPSGKDPFVLGDQFAQLTVQHPRIAAGGQGGVGLAGQGIGDLLGAVALIGEDPAMIDYRRSVVVFQVWVGWRERDWPV